MSVLNIITSIQSALLGNMLYAWIGLGALVTFVPLTGWLIHRGRLQHGAHLLLAGLWTVIVLKTWIGAGLFSKGMVYTLLLIIISSLLTGPGGVLVWTGVTLGSLVALGIGHQVGFIQTSTEQLQMLGSRTIEMFAVHATCSLAMFSVQFLQRRTLDALSEEIATRKAAEEAKERFLTTMSHELRTPLNGILGAATLLPDAVSQPDREALTGMITSSADLLLALVNDILDFSRMDTEAMKLESLPVEIRPLLDEVTAPLALLAQQRGVPLRVAVDADLPGWLMGDPTRLRQLVLNLTSNAVKFTEAGEIAVTADRARDRWRLQVRDTGVGIPREAYGRLFDPFAQVDASTTRRYGGTGLGLAIVRRIVDRMGGEITVESKVGVGSTFSIVLPLHPAAPPRTPSAPDLLAPPHPLRVLLVDDHPINRTVISLHLSRAGHTIEEAADGVEACVKAATEAWDVILMDCQMPRRDGYEATRLIRDLPPPACDVLIVGLSANATVTDRHRALSAGMDDYLTKPIQPAVLLETLAQVQQTPTRLLRG